MNRMLPATTVTIARGLTGHHEPLPLDRLALVVLTGGVPAVDGLDVGLPAAHRIPDDARVGDVIVDDRVVELGVDGLGSGHTAVVGVGAVSLDHVVALI